MKPFVVCIALFAFQSAVVRAESLLPHLEFIPGPINGAIVTNGDARLVVYGVPDSSKIAAERVLLTHHRRDVIWLARGLVGNGTKAIAPDAERASIESPQKFWDTFTTARFHDYAQQSTKILAVPLAVSRWVKDGETVAWRGHKFHVLATPGYTRGAVTYLTELDGKKVAFTGDLIYGDGKLFDLYSFQDAIPEANVRGYHGYAGRLAALVASLSKLAAANPDMLIPARGPVIRNPRDAIEKLIRRVRKLYRNYLSTNALHWYFKEERMRTCGRRVLGKDADIELMPYSLHQKAPDWVYEQATSRMLISDDGHGFLLDCGYQRVIDAIKKLMQTGLVKKVDGIFVTHHHDDHTDMVQAAAEEFKCPVYATAEYSDILENPAAYHIAAMTPKPIKNIKVMKDGQTMKWKEFELTFHYYPGQTYYHGGLFVKKGSERPIFFIGDSFAPSGMDDYCLLNRNLVHEDNGYLLCLKKLRQIQQDFWLVNEHVPFVFSFTKKELDYLESRYRERKKTLQELLPWDDPNYGIDEQWAVFYPYGMTMKSGASAELEVRLTNHSPVKRTFAVTPHGHGRFKILQRNKRITLEPRESGSIKLKITALAKGGNAIVTADISSDGMEFREWAESLVTVE